MTTQQLSPSQNLESEISRLQSEIPRLKAERDTLGRIPILPVGADPSEIAEKISKSVSGNSSRLRGIDSALATLTKSLASKRLQLAELRETERRADLSYRMELLHEDATRSCEKINQISQLLEAEISRLRTIEQAVHPIWYALQPYRPYPYVHSDENLTIIEASTTEVGHHLSARPLRSV